MKVGNAGPGKRGTSRHTIGLFKSITYRDVGLWAYQPVPFWFRSSTIVRLFEENVDRTVTKIWRSENGKSWYFEAGGKSSRKQRDAFVDAIIKHYSRQIAALEE